MDNIINVRVKAREIEIAGQHLPLVADSQKRDAIAVEFDSEWDGIAKRVTFESGDATVTAPLGNPTEIPWECLNAGTLRLSIVGLNADGTEILRTAYHRRGIPVSPRGADLGDEPREATADIVQQAKARLDELEAEIPQVSEEFEAKMQEWDAQVDEAAAIANDAADYARRMAEEATAASDGIMERVESGEFNGAPFEIKYTPASIAAMNAIEGAKQGEFAVISSSVEDPDNAKLFMYGNGSWNFMSDLSGATGFGLQGKQGVSLKNVRVVDQTKVEVTQYDPATEQERTYIVGDFAAPLADGVKSYVDGEFVVVDAFPANPVDGLVYMVRE